jgi:hypothetical protein
VLPDEIVNDGEPKFIEPVLLYAPTKGMYPVKSMLSVGLVPALGSPFVVVALL